MQDFSKTWLQLLTDIFVMGENVSPRGKLTSEIPQKTITVDMRRPVLCIAERSLSYRFMAAEAFWILTGDNKVDSIAPYNARIASFSDDGEKFFGAYGPKIADQMDYVIRKLRQDPDTRQAGLTIWRENPPETKDVPCTVAVFFNIRSGKLNANVFMRSSDAWLGIPYDVFNFSMLSHLVCAYLNTAPSANSEITPGTLYLTAASSHLYESNWADARKCLNTKVVEQNPTPDFLYKHPTVTLATLGDLRETYPGSDLRWWEVK